MPRPRLNRHGIPQLPSRPKPPKETPPDPPKPKEKNVNRFPLQCNVNWFQSRPRIDFELQGSDRGTVSFRGNEWEEVWYKLATGYANLLVKFETLRKENQRFRAALNTPLDSQLKNSEGDLNVNDPK